MEYIKKGNKKVLASKLFSNLKINSDTKREGNYLSLYNLTPEEVTEFLNLLGSYIQGFLNGELTFNDNGEIVDSTGQRFSTDDVKDSKRLVAKYINDIFDRSKAYTDPNDKNKIKYDSSKGIGTAINRILFTKDSFNPDFLYQDDYNLELGKRAHKNRANQLIAALGKLNLNLDNTYLDLQSSDREQLLNGISTLIEKLHDGDLSNADKMFMSNLGLNPDLYFYGKENWDTPETTLEELQTETDPLVTALLQMLELQKQEAVKKMLDAVAQKPLYDRYLALPLSTYRFNLSSPSDTLKFNGFSLKLSNRLNDINIDENPALLKFLQLLKSNDIIKILKNQLLLDTQFDEKPFLGNKYTIKNTKTGEVKSLFGGMTNKDVLSLLLGRLTSSDNNVPLFTNNLGHYIIGNGTLDGYVLTFDKDNRSIYDTRIVDLSPQYVKTIAPLIGSYVDYLTSQVPSLKEGGTIQKAQFGAPSVQFIGETNKEKNARIKEEKKREKDELVAKSGKTEELYDRDNKKMSEGLTAVDKARIAAATADLASLGLSMSLAGSVWSVVPGIAGTLTSAGADIADGDSAWNIAKNMAFGLGMDIVGAVPIVGAPAKIAKVGKVLLGIIKTSPFVLSAVNNVTDPGMLSSLNKVRLGKFKDLTHEDGRNLLHFFQTFTGGARMGIGAAKAGAAKYVGDRTKTTALFLNTEKGKIKVGSGAGEISADKYNNMKGKSVAEINLILESLPGQAGNKIKTSKKIPFIGKEKPKKDTFIENNSYVWDLSKSRERLPWFLRSSKKDTAALEHNLNSPAWSWNLFNLQKGRRDDETVNTVPTSSLKELPLYIGGKPVIFKIGGKFNRASKIVNSLKEGGSIRKYGNGGDFYYNAWTNNGTRVGEGFTSLKGWTNKLRKDASGQWIQDNGHFMAGDLNEAAKRNNAYISNSALVAADLNSYYDKVRNNTEMSGQDYVDYYNKKAGENRDFFAKGLTYSDVGSLDVLNFNNTFFDMFNNRSLEQNGLDYNIGKLGNIADRSGSSTWLRRMDTYEKDWDDLSLEEKKNRLHKVGNFYVAKHANGDIELISNEEAALILATPTNPAEELSKKIFGVKETPETITEPDYEGDIKLQELPSTGYGTGLEAIYHLSRFGRLNDALSTNKTSYNASIQPYISPALMIPKHYQSPIHGDYGALNEANKAAARLTNMSIQSADPSLLIAGRLEAINLGNSLFEQARRIDDAKYAETANVAKARDEKSMESRVDTANLNMLKIEKAREMLAQLRSDYLTALYKARSGFALENEGILNQKLSDYRRNTLNLSETIANINYQAEIKAAEDAYERKVQELTDAGDTTTDVTTLPEYKAYVDAVRTANIHKLNAQNSTIAGLLGFPHRPLKNTTFNYVGV